MRSSSRSDITADIRSNSQVGAAAQNPTDWKHVIFKMAGPGKVVGCDIAGTVVDAKDKSLIGKRVCGPEYLSLIEGRRVRPWRMGKW
jgi:NADPH:quinone reductase-like Zn-dependent oxidoreductase